jgi:cysteinyl-tRNA synthetase
MAMKHLGQRIDVHGGGLDLIFPHHENERAQSEGATHLPFAGTWLHNGMLRFGDEKMSKSLGNVEKLADAIDAWGAETLLLLFARAHYRSPMDYNSETLEQAKATGEGIREAFRGLRGAAGDGSGDLELLDEADARARAFDAAMDDDLATPKALAELFGLVTAVNRAVSAGSLSGRGAGAVGDVFRSRLDVLGLAGLASDTAAPPEVVALAQQRQEARAARDFARADELRGQIEERGFVVRDAGDRFELVPAAK